MKRTSALVQQERGWKNGTVFTMISSQRKQAVHQIIAVHFCTGGDKQRRGRKIMRGAVEGLLAHMEGRTGIYGGNNRLHKCLVRFPFLQDSVTFFPVQRFKELQSPFR